MKILPRATPLVLTVAASALLAGCGSDDEIYPVSIGSNERTASTDALGFAIVSDGEGNGRVVGTLLNTTEQSQKLVGVEVDTERGPAQATLIDGDVPLPAGEPVKLVRLPAVAVSADDLPVGLFVEVTLDIEGAEPIDLLVPVEEQKGPYEEVEVTEAPDGDISPD